MLYHTIDQSNNNIDSTSLINQNSQQFKGLQQQISNDPQLSTIRPFRRAEVSQRQNISNNILIRKQQNSQSSPNSKVFSINAIDTTNFQSSSINMSNSKIRIKPFNSISPLGQKKETNFNNAIESQKLNNLLSKNSQSTQNTNQTSNKSPLFYKKLNQNLVQILNYSYIPLKGEVVKTKEQNKDISLPNKKLTSRFIVDNKFENKENEQQLATIFTLDLDKKVEEQNENNQSTLQLVSNLQGIKQVVSSSNLTIQNNLPTLNQSSSSLVRNYINTQKIKINQNNPYQTKELLIPIHKLDSFQQQTFQLGIEDFKNDSNEKLDSFSLPLYQNLQGNKANDIENQEIQSIIYNQDTVTTPVVIEDKNRKVAQFNTKQGLLNKIKYNQVIKQDSKSILEQILSGNRVKKNSVHSNEQRHQSKVFERQRSLTIQNQLNQQNFHSIERQESLPKIQQNQQSNQIVQTINNQISKQALSSIKEINRRTLIQKRLQDLMVIFQSNFKIIHIQFYQQSYNVEEEFKKRFQGIFKEKLPEKQVRFQKKNEVKKKVHFVFEEVKLL